MRLSISIFLWLLIWTTSAYAQDDSKKFDFDGYIFGLGYRILDKNIKPADNFQFYNRLNFYYNFSDYSQVTLQFRNTAYGGKSYRDNQLMFASTMEADPRAIDMSWNVLENSSLLLNINVDRLFYQYSKEKIEFTLGRQRINWGQTLVWNPNDIFNASSFFDFDYVERPGSDAVRVVYYKTNTTHWDFAAKVDSSGQITAALKYGFNKRNYDIQLLGGVANKDLVAGIGWSGNLWKLGFKGEASLFSPVWDTLDKTVVSLTAALDYSFQNGLYVLVQVLYVGQDALSTASNPFAGQFTQLSARNLSFTEWNIISQASYAFSPLFNASLAIGYYPEFDALIIFPNLSYSVCKNLDVNLVHQNLTFLDKSKSGGFSAMNILYFGLKYYF
ncbi:MAG: hypothetical protein JXR34_06685 [Bacteroidales bacterium]|nr:hypothetical protein [Bacteroidales bacterium]